MLEIFGQSAVFFVHCLSWLSPAEALESHSLKISFLGGSEFASLFGHVNSDLMYSLPYACMAVMNGITSDVMYSVMIKLLAISLTFRGLSLQHISILA